MKLIFKQFFGASLLTVMVAGTACGQKTKIKTITIIDGDTTINEEIFTDKDFAWSDKDSKKSNVKVMKIITSNDDSANADAKVEVFMDDEGEGNDKKSFTKKIIIMDDGGKVKTIESENGYSYEMEINESTKGGGKHKIVNMHGPKEAKNELLLKNINIDINAKTQILKLDLTSENKETMNIVVMDEEGKQVFYDTQKQGDKYKKEIKLGKKGVYFLSIIQNKKVLNERIVVE